MKYSQLLGKTLRKTPKKFLSKGHALLLQAGYIRRLGVGLYSYLPLGVKVAENIKNIMRKELNALEGQEIKIPMINPFRIWQAGGRLDLISDELVKFRDREGRKFVLSPSHEEAAVELLRSSIKSYRDFPLFLYEFQQKFRDEEKVRCGLVRTKEFTMKDAYSFHRSYTDLNNFFPKVYSAYNRIFSNCNVATITAEAGVGYIGGEKSYEFLYPASYGDDAVIVCDNCGYTANKDVAVGKKGSAGEVPKALEVVHTPGCETMDDLASCLDEPKFKLGKPMVYKAKNEYVMAVVRGDYEVSLEKLSRFIGAPILRKASRRELEAMGLIPGYLSPIGMNESIRIVLDDTITNASNLVLGSNDKGYHYINANFGRDFESEEIGDISRIKADDYCIQCGRPLHEVRAVELGNIFKLGDFYTRGLNLFFDDEKGKKIYPHMGAYGIGIGRLMTAVVEANHDDKGILWPSDLAPFKAFLMGIGKSPRVKKTFEQIYDEFSQYLLADDRKESPGIKFQDADLIGLPLRIVLSAKNLQDNKVEFHGRRTGETWLVSTDRISEFLKG